jgi:SAM-dependent methyltransferase
MLYDESHEWVAQYLRAGSSAVDILERGLRSCGRSFDDVSSCLDFGCGYGRVLRHLCRRLAPQRITACDVDVEAVRFCGAEFGVRTIASNAAIRKVRLGAYDLIWVGSVFTHLNAGAVEECMLNLGGSLRPRGVLMLTTHGEFSVSNLGHLYGGVYREQAAAILGEYRSLGISFRPYEQPTRREAVGQYGMTWMSRRYVEDRVSELFEGRVVVRSFAEQEWEGHHDVYLLERVAA